MATRFEQPANTSTATAEATASAFTSSHDAHLTIVIPVYHEAENIERCLDAIATHVRTPHEIRIVYDFDGDNTLPVVQRRMQHQSNIALLRNEHGNGVVGAIRTGLGSVESGMVLVTMADLSDDLSAVDAMVAQVRAGCDLVCGSCYMPGGRQIGGPLVKRTLSRLAGLSLRYLVRFPTHDVTNSFKLYTANVLRPITLESTGGFEIGMEIVVKAYARGARIGEVPVTWRDRDAGESRFRLWRWLPCYLRWYGHAMRAALSPARRKAAVR